MCGFEFNGVGLCYYDDSDLVNVIDDFLGGNVYVVVCLEVEFLLGLLDEYGILGGVFVDYGLFWDLGLDCLGVNYYYCEFMLCLVVGVLLFWVMLIGLLWFNWIEFLLVEVLDEICLFELMILINF